MWFIRWIPFGLIIAITSIISINCWLVPLLDISAWKMGLIYGVLGFLGANFDIYKWYLFK